MYINIRLCAMPGDGPSERESVRFGAAACEHAGGTNVHKSWGARQGVRARNPQQAAHAHCGHTQQREQARAPHTPLPPLYGAGRGLGRAGTGEPDARARVRGERLIQRAIRYPGGGACETCGVPYAQRVHTPRIRHEYTSYVYQPGWHRSGGGPSGR